METKVLGWAPPKISGSKTSHLIENFAGRAVGMCGSDNFFKDEYEKHVREGYSACKTCLRMAPREW